ncbi:unnamed protein product [Durusdinium trenchii]|uniref:Calcineurin-like phosphoesterase domain-containing protein n=1 Tax=Durusdinium trenchii TaxID=1381693 RepID=A0ABP0I5U4_9DINO
MRWLLAVALASCTRSAESRVGDSEHRRSDCAQHVFEAPPKPSKDPMQHNGQALRDTCFGQSASQHVMVIGDWGGVQYTEEMPILPADHRSHLFPKRVRSFVSGVDDYAQHRVAAQMLNLSFYDAPDYVINVGDNFYWGGVNSSCNNNSFEEGFRWNQWGPIFERMYEGGGLDGKQWLGILGNHDYGGFKFTSGWHESIFYTWAVGHESTGRWMTPAQYWQVKVHYVNFSIDYYFVDTNVNNAWKLNASDPKDGHNICSEKHNEKTAECSVTGPVSREACHSWFESLWEVQKRWLDQRLSLSKADWQIVVSHFPPEYNADFWTEMGHRYGIDLIISGHRHYQEVIEVGKSTKTAPPFSFTTIISGGGGGITADRVPQLAGDDDAYGFMDLFLNKSKIHIRAFSHTGRLRRSVAITPVAPQATKEFLSMYARQEAA